MKSKLMSIKSIFSGTHAGWRYFALIILCLATLSAYSDELSDAVKMAEARIKEKYASELAIERERSALKAIIINDKLSEQDKLKAIKERFFNEKSGTQSIKNANNNASENVESLLISAKRGEAEAQYNLANCYANGEGIDKNINEAVNWWHKAAEQGLAKAQYNLGLCYFYGNGVSRDLAEALKWLRKAAEQGFAEAQLNLGICYLHGYGITANINEAVKWWRMAAEQGHATAQYNLGVCHELGYGIVKGLRKAKGYLFLFCH